ncbi:MAG: hypothetical protein Q4Q04_01175 [Methanocorpusculum sp.]|nr:hypothetical protein [Methanocorpusculum sp.]
MQMKIKGITLRLPPLLLAATVFFAAVCAMSFGQTKDLIYISIGIPLCIILIGVPLFLAYLNEKQAASEAPGLRKMAKFVRARQVTASMKGTPVILEGKILKVTGLYMNKPAYLIQDGTGQIVVRRFALPDPLVGIGANVEVLGRVFGKVTDARSVYINASTIRPIAKLRPDEAEEPAEHEPEKIHIKKLPN